MLAFSSFVAAELAKSDLEIVVTGAGGWLGQATLEMLDQAFGEKLQSRVHIFAAKERQILLRSGRMLPCNELKSMEKLHRRPCLVAHYAFVTKDRIADRSVPDFIHENESIGDFVATQLRRLPVAGIFVPSSGAVYPRGIEEYPVRNAYGEAKARDECRFRSLAENLRCRAVIMRIFNLSGPFINNLSTYVLASILLDLAKGGPIRLHADRPVIRSYVHVSDLINLAFSLMLRQVDPPSDPFDTAGEVEIEIGGLARLAAAVLGKPDTAIIRSPISPHETDRYVGDGGIFRRLTTETGVALTPLDQQIIDTSDYLR